MQRTTLKTATGRDLILRACLLLLVTGCHPTHVEEAEHHAPVHKPVDFPAAVDRLLELHVEISRGGHRASDQMDVFAEAHDIARWLPELAADSDLPEDSWNHVHETARRVEAILTDVRSNHGHDRSKTYLTYETELDRHQRGLIEIKRQFRATNVFASDQPQ